MRNIHVDQFLTFVQIYILFKKIMVKEVSIFKMLLKNIDLLYIQQKTINKMH